MRIYANDGGNATFNLNSGTISNNSAVGNAGGGVKVMAKNGKAVMNMNGGTISGNYAKKGGGIDGFLHEENTTGTVDININGGTISGNYLSFGNTTRHNYPGGAGISVYGKGLSLWLRGGTISNNDASSGRGGGLYCFNQARCVVAGATITNNRCNKAGCGGGIKKMGEVNYYKTAGTVSGNIPDDVR